MLRDGFQSLTWETRFGNTEWMCLNILWLLGSHLKGGERNFPTAKKAVPWGWLFFPPGFISKEELVKPGTPLCVLPLHCTNQPRSPAQTGSSASHFLHQLHKSLNDRQHLMGNFLVSILWCHGLAGRGGKYCWFCLPLSPYDMPHFKTQWAPPSLRHTPHSII